MTVQGSGFAPNTTSFGSLTVGLCPSDILTDPTQAPFRCSATAAFPVPVDDAGHFVAQLQVFRTQPTSVGGNTLNCLAPIGCVVLAIEVVNGPEGFDIIVATAPVTFRALTKQECKKNGWRTLTDTQGRPFRNQGQCIRFVNTGK